MKDVYNEAVDEHCEDGTVVATITVSASSVYSVYLAMVSKFHCILHSLMFCFDRQQMKMPWMKAKSLTD